MSTYHHPFWIRLAFLFVLLSLFTDLSAFAQSRGGKKSGGADIMAEEATTNYEVSFFLGDLLPNQVPHVREIVPQWGLRAGVRAGPYAFMEGGGIAGKGNGASWSNLFASLRFNVPIETMMGHVFLGGDVHQYQPDGKTKKTFGGGHIGGGIMSPIAAGVWFRGDMKFNINPGTSLLIDAGFMYRF